MVMDIMRNTVLNKIFQIMDYRIIKTEIRLLHRRISSGSYGSITIFMGQYFRYNNKKLHSSLLEVDGIDMMGNIMGLLPGQRLVLQQIINGMISLLINRILL